MYYIIPIISPLLYDIIQAKALTTHQMSQKKKIIHYTILVCIVCIALIVRVYNIDGVPSGIYPDEANNGTNAYDAQLTGNYQWFYPDNNGREGLYLNMMALCFALFGVSFLTFKLSSIIMGTLTVIGVYCLSRELFISKPRIALIASYLTAVSFWAINFSRIAFRAIMMLPILLFSFYFLFRGIRTKKWHHFAIAGLIFGLGFHTYIAFRIAPALLGVALVLFVIQNGTHFIKTYWRKMLIFIVCACISAAPMFYTFHKNPTFVNARTSDVSIFSQKGVPLTHTLTKTVSLSLAKYNFYGDQNWRHGYPPHAVLAPFAGVIFLCGFVLSLILFVYHSYHRIFHNSRNKKLIIHGFLIAWFGAFLAPEFMTVEGLPHSLRSIGTLPIVYIFGAFIISFLIDHAHKKSVTLSTALYIMSMLLLLWAGLYNITKYHVHWAHEPQQAAAFNKDLTDIGMYLQTLPAETEKYVITGPLMRLPVRLLNTQTPHVSYLYENELARIDTSTKFYVLMPYYNDTVIDTLTQKTDITITEIATELDTSFIVITPSHL